MAGKSDYLENKILDHILGATAYSAPATLYFALFTSAPNDAGSGTEVSGGSYARVAVTNNATNFPNAASGTKSNGAAIAFAQATATWGTITSFAIFDALSSGNMLFWADLTTPRTVQSGDTLSFPIGSILFIED